MRYLLALTCMALAATIPETASNIQQRLCSDRLAWVIILRHDILLTSGKLTIRGFTL